MHKVGIIHRDVKTANVLMGADGHIVLADFGSSKFEGLCPFLPGNDYEDSQPRTPAQLTFVTGEMLGPEVDLAPEVVLGEYHSFGVDFWFAGSRCKFFPLSSISIQC